MGLAIFLMLIIGIMAFFGLVMLIGGIIFIIIGIKEKKKNGKNGLMIAGIIMTVLPLLQLLHFVGYIVFENLQ